MKAIKLLASTSLLMLFASSCDQRLAVQNLTDPDIKRVFATGQSIESTIGSGYQTVHNAMANTNNQPGVEVFGLESYSQLNNFNLGTRAAIPRLPINNVIGAPSIFSEFTALSKQARLVINALNALDELNKVNLNTGSAARDMRARSFGMFVAGASLGWMAMMYDSAAIVTLGMPADEIPPLSGSAAVGKAAIGFLDSALAIANNPAAAGGFPLEAIWMGNATGLSLDQYKRILRSYRARIRAGITRTPAQAAAVEWAKVIDDAENGIQANFMVNTGSSTGWSVGYQVTRYQDATWSEMSLMYMGMADVSGGYANFISADLSRKNGWFLVITPDKRWPQGSTRAAQNTASVQPTSATSLPYVSNRSISNDVTGDGWGISFYDYFRYRYIKVNSNSGPFPEFLKAENDLLAAEGYLRTGNIAKAAEKIDLSRVGIGGLPALSGVITSATQAVPGGIASCVPQVPQGNGTVACGNIFEAMKYEKRMETMYSAFGRFWIDGRGWGDLVEGTPLEFPVPYQEMQSRQLPYYLLGPGFGSAAAKGVYGF